MGNGEKKLIHTLHVHVYHMYTMWYHTHVVHVQYLLHTYDYVHMHR